MRILGIDPGLSRQQIATRAYIAGLLDGDGYICIKRRLPTAKNRMVSPKYSIAVGIAMTDEEPVKFVARFCGLEHQIKKRLRKAHYKTIYCFDIEHALAAKLLRCVQPFLVGKSRQAERSLALAALREKSREHRTRVTQTLRFKSGNAKGHEYRVFGLSLEFLAQCDAIYREVLGSSPRSGEGGCFRARIRD